MLEFIIECTVGLVVILLILKIASKFIDDSNDKIN
jgi:hypothetical protein